MSVLFVVTNQATLGQTDKKTGWYLPEAAHPYHVIKNAGYAITFVSPKGGKAPVDPGSVDGFKDDPICTEFLKTQSATMEITKSPADINPKDFKALFYVGGHGPMFDLPDCEPIAKLAQQIYENGGILGAVCHGTVGLVPVKLSNGDSVLKGQIVTSFTNAEENAANMMDAMPFPLETRLAELAAKFTQTEIFQEHIQVSGRIITGQNPASATAVGEAIVKALKSL